MARKHAIPSIIANVIYLLISAFSLVSINLEIKDLENLPPPESGVDMSGLSIGILKIVAIFILIYVGIVVLNLILKLMQAIFSAWGFAIPCILIDLLLLVISGALLVNAVSNDPSPMGLIFASVMSLVGIWSIVANVKTMVHRNE